MTLRQLRRFLALYGDMGTEDFSAWKRARKG